MSSAKRRINSTGRKRIKREHIEIRMREPKPGEPLKATARLELADLGFPDDARVVIEAYHRSSGMQFDCGTVGRLRIPETLSLDEVDRRGTVLFRVKVVDTGSSKGRLLGSAERIQARSEDEGDGRRSIFPIRTVDLGQELWRVEIADETRPVLQLNCRLPGFKNSILEDPLLQGVLLPAALRIVLSKLAEDPSVEEDSETDWKEEWIRFCQEELKVPGDPSDFGSAEDRETWVDAVIERFCEQHRMIERARRRVDGDEHDAAAA